MLKIKIVSRGYLRTSLNKFACDWVIIPGHLIKPSDNETLVTWLKGKVIENS
jgi:hypothetical protein